MTFTEPVVCGETQFAEQVGDVSTSHRRVLLIDDSEDAMLLVKSALKAFGNDKYRLSWAKTLHTGLQEVADVDLVLLDLGLPESSGEASYASVRNGAKNSPIVVFTGDDCLETKDAILADGARDYLVKQCTSGRALVQAIDAAILGTKSSADKTFAAHEKPTVHNILIIEDDKDAVTLVRHALDQHGGGRFHLDWETSIRGGIERVASGGIELVLLDLGLPDSVGCAGYQDLRRAAQDVPVVVLSGNQCAYLEFAVLACGADEYLDKRATSGPELTQVLDNVLCEDQARKQKKNQNPTGRTVSKSFWGM